MEYKLMIPPNEISKISELSKKEAKEHFEWYISQIPIRLEQLENYVKYTTKNNFKFDKSVDSLIYLWKWFETIIETERKTKIELEKELENLPEWLHEQIKINNIKPTTLTLSICLDIGIYFSETLIYNNPSIKWDYIKTSKNISFNKPVLVGFKNGLNFEPSRILNVCLNESIKKHNSMILRDLYDIWINNI